jgi:acyl-CoA thioesterase-1
MGFCLQFVSNLAYGAAQWRGKILAGLMALLVAGTPVRADGDAVLLAFGDSLTQGYGLPEADGFVPQLKRWLDDQGRAVQVINGGVSGDTTAGGAARVGWSLTEDVDAMIVTLGGNDMLRGIDPSVARENLATILQEAQAQGVSVLLVGMEAPGNYGADYKRAFDAMYPELAEAYDALYFKSFFNGLGEGDPSELQRFFQSDGIHPNAEGVSRIVAALGPKVIELLDRAGAAAS